MNNAIMGRLLGASVARPGQKSASKGLTKRSDDHVAARTVQDREVHEPEYPGEIATQRALKLSGNIAWIVFEYATSPRAENDCVIALCRRNRKDLADSALQSTTDLLSACRVLLERGSCIGSRRSQKRAHERSFQELPLIVAKDDNSRRVNHVIRVKRVAMALMERVHRPAIKAGIEAR